eukprot:4892899-Pleurochrysis_carterae.AAC.1
MIRKDERARRPPNAQTKELRRIGVSALGSVLEDLSAVPVVDPSPQADAPRRGADEVLRHRRREPDVLVRKRVQPNR